MPQVRISITVDGTDQFNRVFARTDKVLDDLTPVWPELQKEFWRIEREQFASEGGAGASGRWKELSARYKAVKAKRYGAGKRILEATGALTRSLTSMTGDTYYQTTKKEFGIGTKLPYGLYHQRGGGRLPKREPISFSDVQKQSMTKVIHKAMIEAMNKGNDY